LEDILRTEKPIAKKKIVVGKEKLALKKELEKRGVTEKPPVPGEAEMKMAKELKAKTMSEELLIDKYKRGDVFATEGHRIMPEKATVQDLRFTIDYKNRELAKRLKAHPNLPIEEQAKIKGTIRLAQEELKKRAVTEKPAAKEPWGMKRRQFYTTPVVREMSHEKYIRQALSEGKSPYKGWEKDYPELAKGTEAGFVRIPKWDEVLETLGLKREITPRMLEQDASVQAVWEAIKEAKPLRKEQEALYTKERGARFGRAKRAGAKAGGGERGFYAEKGKLKGEMPQAYELVDFEYITKKVKQQDWNNMFNRIADHPVLTYGETLTGRNGLSKIMKGKLPVESELNVLRQVFGPEFTRALLEKRPLLQRMADMGYEVANVPRAIMASFDLSAPFRQGWFLVGHPKYFVPNMWQMIKAFGSEGVYKGILTDIVQNPQYQLAKRSKVSFTDIDAFLTGREERFMGSWLAEKIPVAGKVIRASNRAYTAFLNKLRMDAFADLVKKAEASGLDPQNNLRLTRQMADLINNATGRGTKILDVVDITNAAKTLNTVFFSPRLMASRTTLLTPSYYLKLDPFLRKQALYNLASAVGASVSILSLAKVGGADVETNPASTDFGKAKIGNTRVDALAGFGQYMVAGYRILSGKYISSVTGKEIKLGEGYKPISRWDIFIRQIETKEAPTASFVTSLLKGQDYLGRALNVPKEIGNRFVPMVIGDAVDVCKDDPNKLPLVLAAVFGMGLQTYETYPKQVQSFYRIKSKADIAYSKLKTLEEKDQAEFIRQHPELIYKTLKMGIGGETKNLLSYTQSRLTELMKTKREINQSDIDAERKKKATALIDQHILSITQRALQEMGQ